MTTMGVGIIIEENVSTDRLPRSGVLEIFRLAKEKEEKIIKNDWWNVVLEIHQMLSDKGKKKLTNG